MDNKTKKVLKDPKTILITTLVSIFAAIVIFLTDQFEFESSEKNFIQYQENSNIERCRYKPIIANLRDDSPYYRVYMDKFDNQKSLINPYYYSESQDAISTLRAGDLNLNEALWLFLTIWMLNKKTVGFQYKTPVQPHLQ